MQVANAPGRWASFIKKANPPRFIRQGEFGLDVENYTGPRDGKSQAAQPSLMKTLNHHLVLAEYRKQVEGVENLPRDGKYVYCSTHPTFFDPVVVANVVPGKDLRFVASEKVFDGARGVYMTCGGAFPVDLDWGRLTTVRHAVESVEQGKNLVIFPEGKISKNFEEVERLKRGAAAIARFAEADGLVPLAVHYQKDPEPRTTERVVGGVVAAGAGLGLAAAGLLGGPLGLAAGAVSFGLAGAFAGGKAARKLSEAAKDSNYVDPFARYFVGMEGAAKGALAGAVVGTLATGLAPGAAVVSGLAGFLGTLGFSEALATRPLAQVKIGEPLLLKDFSSEGQSGRQKDHRVTERLHQSLGELKADLTGVPYDQNSPKVFDLSENPIYPGPGL